MDIIQIRLAIRFTRVFLDLFLILLLWTKGKSKATFYLGLTILFFGVQAVAAGLLWYIKTDRLFLIRSQWLIILAVPALLSFIYYFTNKTKYIKLKILLWYIPAVVTVIFALFTDYFVVAIPSGSSYPSALGVLDPIARICFIAVAGIVGFYYLLRGYLESQGDKKRQLRYFMIAGAVFAAEKAIVLGILPILYPDPSLIYFYSITEDSIASFVVLFMVYIIFSKKMVFEIKVIVTEILVGAIALILFIQAFLAQETASKVFGSATFFFFLFAGYLLIRTTRKEIQGKEEVEKLAKELEGLNKNLEEKVEGRTKELKTSYQEIKARKESLERFYNLAVGRELKMAELKKEIEKLK